MLNSVLTISFFALLGIGWRILKPQGISADALLRQLIALIHTVLLPVAVFFVIFRLPMNEAAARILLYVLFTTALTLAVAWFWLLKSGLPSKSKGAFLIAAAFGNLFFLGLPLNDMLISGWATRIAVEYGLVANVLLLFTAGAILSRQLAQSGKARIGKSAAEVLKDYRIWLREPLVWAALAGLILNLAGLSIPSWLGNIETAVYGVLIPLLLFSTALAVNWKNSWKIQLVDALPVAAIQLVLVPLLMWGSVSLFGSAGLKTTQALYLDSMLPASVLGFAVCERYKLDTESYGLAFSLTTVLAIVTVPIWFKILL